MFGHHDDDQPQDNGAPDGAAPAVADQPDQSGFGQPDSQPQDTDTPAVSLDPVIPDNPEPSNSHSDQPPAEPAPEHPAGPPSTDKDQINDIISPAGGFPKRPSYQYPQGSAPPPDDIVDTENANPELIDIRDHALDELEPLLDKLDLPPEEMFRAIMMIMQSKDDQALVKKAYEAAHAIKDDELRARALYDIVNEVNYFTQPPQEP